MIQRLMALASKEFIQIRRDPRTLAMMIALPLIWLIMFGYAFSFDIQEMRVAVADQSGTRTGAVVAEALRGSERLRTVDLAEMTEAGIRDAIYRDQVQMGILIPPGFGEGARDANPPMLLLIDGADLFGAQTAARLVQQALEPVQGEIQQEILYNPELRTANVMVPGLLGLVTMFMTTMMTAVGIVREREYGTLEQLVVTPIRPLELMIGKLLPYAVVAVVQFAVVFAAGTLLFGLSFAGNLPLFLALSALFLVTTLGLGLLLSTLAHNQQQAMQLAMFAIFPQVLLSGLIFPFSSMPVLIQYIARALPFTYFVPIARGMFLKGQDLSLLMTPALVLAVYAVVTVSLASLRFRKRLG